MNTNADHTPCDQAAAGHVDPSVSAEGAPEPGDARDACCGGQCHSHSAEVDPKKERNVLLVLALFYALALIFENAIDGALGPWGGRIVFFIPYAVCGVPVFTSAWRTMSNGSFLNEFTLMAGATLVALGLDFPAEAAGVMLFYRIGEFFQERAAGSSRKSIKSLLAAKPKHATVLVDGEARVELVEKVMPGQYILVRAGESIALDGQVTAGSSFVDQSPLTGESLPVAVSVGDTVMGGSINAGGVITVLVTSAFANTHMARILEMVENASAHKAPTERFITRFARYYTPAVVVAALLVAVVPPLFFGAEWQTWVYRALVLLVVSCPCALVLSVPLSYFAGIGAASRMGILIKGGAVLDALTHIDTVVFDKTGTLTKGIFEVARVTVATGVNEADLLHAVLLAECDSSHPLGNSIMQRFGADFVRPAGLAVHEFAGKGVQAELHGVVYRAGTDSFLAENGITSAHITAQGSVVHVAMDSQYLGCIVVADVVKNDAGEAVSALKAQGKQVLMLTGDRNEAAAWVAATVGITSFKAQLLPEGKVAALNELHAGDRAAFVGDGINDAPILALSRVGIAMGGSGAEAAVEAADAVILNDSPAKVAVLFSLAARVRAVVWQNVALALGVKTLFMGLGVAGISGLWEAVFADVGVALLAVLNAARVSRE